MGVTTNQLWNPPRRHCPNSVLKASGAEESRLSSPRRGGFSTLNPQRRWGTRRSPGSHTLHRLSGHGALHNKTGGGSPKAHWKW